MKHLFILFALTAFITSTYAQNPVNKIPVSPEKASPVTIPKFDHEPVIDGRIDDDIWKNAAVFKDFYQIQPGDNIAPSRQTIAFVGYDEKNLYVAIHAFDEPDKIRATIAERDDIFRTIGCGLRLIHSMIKGVLTFFILILSEFRQIRFWLTVRKWS